MFPIPYRRSITSELICGNQTLWTSSEAETAPSGQADAPKEDAAAPAAEAPAPAEEPKAAE
jgi:hypothetical protein